jgi:glycosyltransferase involved in cell wall biosynthesis
MEQYSPPLRYARAIVAEESAKFPGWAAINRGKLMPWDYRMEAEWQVADGVFVPSAHLIDISKQFGADPRKFRVIPYPARMPTGAGKVRQARSRRPLRAVFAGNLMLEKGVQYIYEALKGRPELPVHVDFFGPIDITPLGVRRISEVGTVHGPVPRSDLFRAFRSADFLLFPSLSEGSALVTLEASALGLPVVATAESGAPESAMIIPSRNPSAIIDALEELADDPARLESLSRAGLEEAARRSTGLYNQAVTSAYAMITATNDQKRHMFEFDNK